MLASANDATLNRPHNVFVVPRCLPMMYWALATRTRDQIGFCSFADLRSRSATALNGSCPDDHPYPWAAKEG